MVCPAFLYLNAFKLYSMPSKVVMGGRGQKKVCDTNPLVVVVNRDTNGEISKKV